MQSSQIERPVSCSRLASCRPNVLGRIPEIPSRRSLAGRATIVHIDPRGAAAVAFGNLRDEILASSVLTQGSSQVITVTSAARGEGKTTCASNLAIAFAQAGAKVAYIEADRTRAAMNEILDLRPGAGWADVLRSPAAVGWAVQETCFSGVHALPGGSDGTGPLSVDSDRSIEELIARLRTAFDHVIIDAPDAESTSERASITRRSDLALSVVAKGERTTEVVEAARVAIVSNRVTVRPAEKSCGSCSRACGRCAVATAIR